MPPKIIKRNRRRLGARQYKNYSEEMLRVAVDLVRNKITTSYDAEKQFGIPRRTIENRVKNLHSDKPGPRYRLSEEEEEKFIKVLIAAADYGCPLTNLDLKLTVFEYLKKKNKAYIFNNQIPGDWWVKNFIERHKAQLTIRATQNITKKRAATTLQEFKEYFTNLEISLHNVPPKNILNFDETNVTDDPGSEKCIFRRGVKYPERILNASKSSISIMFAGTADGEILPPYVVYKAEHLWTEWCRDGPQGARYNRSKSGWFDSVLFLDWFTNIIIPWASQLDGPKIIIGDNLSSHLNPEVIELCELYQIRFAFLPPRSTHITQPLDVAFFGPLKKEWRKILRQYKIENPKQISLNKTHFPLLLKELMDSANLKKENMLSGFRATGIYPFNPYEVYKKLPEYEDDGIRYDVDETLLEYLKSNKHPNPIKRKKNTKLNVPPGKSVSSADFPSCSSVNPTTKPKTTTKKKTIIKGKKNAITDLTTDNKTKRRKKCVESSSDSESICSIPFCDSSEYDPKIDEDTDRENDINESLMIGIECEESVKDHQDNIEESLVPDEDKSKQLVEEKVDEIADNQETRKDNQENMEVTNVLEGSKESPKVQKVVVLSDIKNTAENKAYFDLRQYGPLKLHKIKSNHVVNVECIPEVKTTKNKLKVKYGGSKENEIKKLPSYKNDMDGGAGCSKEPEQNTNLISYNVNDYVLVRYIFKKRIEYYVGKVIVNLAGKYQVTFFKRSGRNDNIKFILPKKGDVDTIDQDMIVKQVELIPLNEKETEFIFSEDDDSVYFD